MLFHAVFSIHMYQLGVFGFFLSYHLCYVVETRVHGSFKMSDFNAILSSLASTSKVQLNLKSPLTVFSTVSQCDEKNVHEVWWKIRFSKVQMSWRIYLSNNFRISACTFAPVLVSGVWNWSMLSSNPANRFFILSNSNLV